MLIMNIQARLLRFLEAYNFSRDEIKSGLKDITVRYGIDGFAEMFL